MHKLLASVRIQIGDKLFLKDPESSDLGRRIIAGSIDLIDEIGFEGFNFRKLAIRIHSTEASVYRYFENKHRLLLYLFSWFWSWTEYRLVFATANLEDSCNKLEKAIHVLTRKVVEDSDYTHINEVKLHRIVVAESSKAYLNREVETEKQLGAFKAYNQLVERVSEIILEVAPAFPYPHMLASSVIEGAHHQRFFAEHLPHLTDTTPGDNDAVTDFYTKMVAAVLQ